MYNNSANNNPNSNKKLHEEDYDSFVKKVKNHSIPDYMFNYYNWAYINPKNVDRLDKNYIYHTILFGQGAKLMASYLKEIPKGARMLQIAHIYGNLLKKVLQKLGPTGKLDIIDVVPYQLEKARQKLSINNVLPRNVDMWVQNAKDIYHREYDIIGAYFLLHEVPDEIKSSIINNALEQIVENNAKIVFIDYHNPNYYHPVRFILNLINYFVEPFANSLWKYDISYFAKKPNRFTWKKETFFGGVYQKVIITKS